MTTFVNNDVQSGNIIYAADHNEQGARTAAVLNGGIDSSNLADGAVSTAKLVDGAVSTAKLVDGAVTSAKLGPAVVKRQNNTTNTTVTAPRFETGWGVIQNGGSSVAQLTETVTFSQEFSDLPIITVTYGGDAGNVPYVYGTGGGVSVGAVASKASSITTTTFVVTLTAPSVVWTANQTIYYQWIAIGN